MRRIIKAVSLLMCISVALGAFGFSSFAAESVLGDVDANGVVDTADVRMILRMAAEIDYGDLSVADMNGDGVISVRDAIEALNVASSVGGVVIPDKNGENFLSDSKDNEFIKIISSEFGVDSEALVAIYSVPDSGTNYVLQFKKSISGSYKKNADGLEKVYHIGLAPERKISYTNGKLIAGDHYNCEAAEGVLVFNLVQSEVMAQYPSYFK